MIMNKCKLIFLYFYKRVLNSIYKMGMMGILGLIFFLKLNICRFEFILFVKRLMCLILVVY